VSSVNFFGLLSVTQVYFPLLWEAKGVVVNQSSTAGLKGTYQPFVGSYGGSKSAVNKLDNTMRVELASFDVKVRPTIFCPGLSQIDLLRNI